MVRTVRRDDDATARLCAVIATDSRAPVALPDQSTEATVRLAQRPLYSPFVVGVRFVVPGAQSAYVFDGFTRDGRERLHFRRPVTGRAARRVPIGAADSIVEAALDPAPATLDAVVRSTELPIPKAQVRVGRTLPPNARPNPSRAVLVARDLPFFDVHLSDACPVVTIAVPMMARIDQRIRVIATAGDIVRASGAVETGRVMLGFEEAMRFDAMSSLLLADTGSTVVGPDGQVTLRAVLGVVSRRQRPDQLVYLQVGRGRAK